jgi:hypothetical protein
MPEGLVEWYERERVLAQLRRRRFRHGRVLSEPETLPLPDQPLSRSVPYVASQAGIVSAPGGSAHVGVDNRPLQFAGCGFRGECVADISPFLPDTRHTVAFQRTSFEPLHADYLIYLQAT